MRKHSLAQRAIVPAIAAGLAFMLAGASSAGASTGSTAATKSCVPGVKTPKSWAKVVAGAKKEGSVNLYTVQPTLVTSAMVAGFAAACPGIHVNVVNTTTASLSERFDSEYTSAGKPSADMYEAGDEFVDAKKYPGAFLRPTVRLIPSLAAYPKSAIAPEGWVGDAYRWGIIYNTKLLKASDIPSTWAGLPNPMFANKITGADPRAAVSYGAFYLFMQQKEGNSWLAGLKRLNQVYTQASTPAVQSVAAGQYALMFPGTQSFSTPLIAEGAPLAIKFPTPSQINAAYDDITKHGPHPDAARVLAAFWASPTGQEIQCKVGGLSSVNPKAGGACRSIKLPHLGIANETPSSVAVDKAASLLGLSS